MRRPESEVNLVLITRNYLPDYDPRKGWLTGIWERACGSGWLRGDIESVMAADEWQSALDFCRSLGRVSVAIQ